MLDNGRCYRALSYHNLMLLCQVMPDDAREKVDLRSRCALADVLRCGGDPWWAAYQSCTPSSPPHVAKEVAITCSEEHAPFSQFGVYIKNYNHISTRAVLEVGRILIKRADGAGAGAGEGGWTARARARAWRGAGAGAGGRRIAFNSFTAAPARCFGLLKLSQFCLINFTGRRR
ncbi:hypothetical protein EVAR_53872_1 [Eumeta japonica]|uniref:Uncharacterized protein n=1 Tax=Eumeta variegata TaxID=151549 RepID=A0A4C1XHX8_EUMVA|nr:hypothetical protein EVAR_53872_1 [Eumeta japonica]